MRGHTVVQSSSLIPDDPSVLLTSAGMQQFKPYFTGKADPKKDFGSKNTASIQKCFRTSDIDMVGDESHLTFFEMLGNFSFGGYGKKEAISLAKEFLENMGFKIDHATVFSGDEKTPFDEESYHVWQSLGVKEIRKAGREDNFWGPTGNEGPCGPTTEIYINGVEIWNIVFNDYYCTTDGNFEKLKTPGVDTGMGLERLAMIAQNRKNIFETDLFAPLLGLLPKDVLELISEKHKRIIIDHLRGIAFLIADGVRPSNKETGYVLRRLTRRVLVYENIYKIPPHVYDAMLHDIVHEYGEFYTELLKENGNIRDEFKKEKIRFTKTLERGVKKLPALKEPIGAEQAFHLYETYGLPFEIIKELGGVFTLNLTREAFDKELEKHKEISRSGVEKKFGGHGLLLDTGELKAGTEEEVKIVTRLHTATHLLQGALQKILGSGIKQAGSDITSKRTRFDFVFERKLTNEELKKVEDLVNETIKKGYDVVKQEMPLEEALKSGALHLFREKYPERVTVYTIGDPLQPISRELCGGPHVKNTLEIGYFKIIKQEAIGVGIRRLRARVE